MVCFPNAKINIGLNVTEKRADGFHNIESIFLPIGLCDVLEVVESKQFEFTNTGREVDGGAENNLCVRAYEMLKKHFDLPPVKIHLHKIIPMGAGLGGGSADAAFFIKLLNEKFGLWIPWGEIYDFANKLGSDCPFFISNKPSYVFGRGDEFENIGFDLAGHYVVIVFPNIHVDTKAVYSGIVPRNPVSDLRSDIKLPVGEWKDRIKNDFEEVVFNRFPEVKAVKEKLYSQGALYVSMSGSGSAVYGLFRESTSVQKFFPDYFVWESPL